MSKISDISAFIIAGGKSERFGQDKTLYEYRGKPLISRVYDAIEPVFENISVVANDSEKLAFLGLNVYPDIIPGLGPIGGIHTALKLSSTDRIFVFAADMPYLNSDFIRYMTEIPDFYDVIVPAPDGYFEPLHAIYSAKLISLIEYQINEGSSKISNLFNSDDVRVITDDEIIFYDDSYKLFANINRLEDVKDKTH